MIMRKFFILILVIFYGLNLQSQSKEFMLIPFELNGLWGYMNDEKKIIVEPKYEEAFITFNSIARIKKNGKYGYIDNKGKLIVNPKYDDADDFNGGVAKVRRGKKITFIDTKGKIFTGYNGNCGYHSHFRAPILLNDSLIEKRRYSILQKAILNSINSSIDSIYDINEYLFIAKKNNKIAIIEDSPSYRNVDSIINSIRYEYDAIKYFSCDFDDGGIKNHIGIKKSDVWGYFIFNDWPTQKIESKYLSIGTFENEFARVEFEPNRFGYIDLQGNEYFFRK